jgi:peptidoglycan/LPS O-acetylase OafA/YrhL
MGSLRFLLALAVAGGHAASMFGFAGTWIFPGREAVQIFYMISGFLIAMILNQKYADTPHSNWIFYSNRIAKIFVPYLIILAATVCACLVSRAVTGNAILLNAWFAEAVSMDFRTSAFALLTNILIVGQEWAFLLIYRAGSLFLALNAFEQQPMASQFIVILPAWTLSIELLFYLIAPFILRRNVLLIVGLALAAHCFRFASYHFGYYSEATNYRFFPFELSLFLYGAVIFRLGKILIPGDPRWCTRIAVLTAVTIIFLPRLFRGSQYELYALIGVALPALLDFSRRHHWDVRLGELSYPLYLVHWPIGAWLASTLDPRWIGKNPVLPVLSVLAAIAAAAFLNRYIVAPVDRWRQARVKAADIPPGLAVASVSTVS